MKYLTKVPFIRIWANLFIFKGKETTKQFLSDLILYTLFSIALIVVWQLYFTPLMPTLDTSVASTFVVCYVVVIPLISMTSRRFCTVGLPWGLSFLILVPLLGYFWTAIVSLSANSTEESQIKIAKNRVKAPIIAASIASLPASIDSAVVLLIFLVILSFYIPYHIHRQAILQQAFDVFEDSEGHVYYSWLRSYDSDSLYKVKDIKMVDDDGDRLNLDEVVFDDNYICVTRDDGNKNQNETYYVFIYDKSFDLIERLDMPDDYYIGAVKLINGKLYYVLREGETKDRTLFRYSIETKETKTIKEHIEKNTQIIDEDITFYYNRNYNIDYLEEKTPLDRWYENTENGQIKHYLFADKVDVSFIDKEYRIVANGELFTFDKKDSANTFCSNAFLIDNKLIFATYEKLPRYKCGSDQYGYCICRQGKSFLYCFDLETKSLILMKEYMEGTFLVDYDLEGAKYYYNGGLYINNVFHRECERIEPGKVEIKKGESYFRSGEEKLNYSIAFYKGEFYGI